MPMPDLLFRHRFQESQKPYHEEILGSLETAYSDSVGAASSKLQEALSAASTIVYGTPTPAYQSVWESLSSGAQSRMSDGLSAASAQYEEARNYVASLNAPAPEEQKLLGKIQEQYYAGIGMAHARYSDFINAASSAVLPTKTPFHESIYSRASASIVGTPTPALEAALSTAKAHYSSAVAGASSQARSSCCFHRQDWRRTQGSCSNIQSSFTCFIKI